MPEDTYKTEGGEDKAWRELAGKDPESVTAGSLAEYDKSSGLYRLKILGELYRIDPLRRRLENITNPDRPEEYLLSLATPVYMTNARPIPPSGELVKEFPGSDFFFRGAHTLPLEAIENRYGNDRAGFEEACARELGGTGEPAGDCGCRFSIYPRVSMAFILWLEDDEFPARAGLLFDSNAGKHMALDVVWAAALVSCHRLLGFKG